MSDLAPSGAIWRVTCLDLDGRRRQRLYTDRRLAHGRASRWRRQRFTEVFVDYAVTGPWMPSTPVPEPHVAVTFR